MNVFLSLSYVQANFDLGVAENSFAPEILSDFSPCVSHSCGMASKPG
jgi:hypothetical protein